MGDPIHPINLPEISSMDGDDYVVVEVGGVYYKAKVSLVWAAGEAANQYTQTEFRDAGDAINTTDKFLGKMSFDTTNAKPVYASGPETTDAWLWVSDDSTAHTPT